MLLKLFPEECWVFESEDVKFRLCELDSVLESFDGVDSSAELYRWFSLSLLWLPIILEN